VDFKKQIRHPALAGQATMFVGVDVTHDKKLKGSFGKTTPGSNSTVGFTASFNSAFTSYHSYVAYQGKNEEYVRTSRQLMSASLEAFKAKVKTYPVNVIVYRDGVGNSQLETFVRKEIREYESAFKGLGIKPNLTVVVVQKRVQVRFFDACQKYLGKGGCRAMRCDGRQQYHSPQAGTIVDTGIVSPLFSDFYLVPSIAPPNATARPTRFIVIRDDLNFSSDDIQALTNQFCYMYFNWPGPIRVPAPCMYAHKLAYLFGKHVNGDPNPRMNGKLFYL